MDLESIMKNAMHEFDLRHYANALPLFAKCAKKGNKDAKYRLGILHFNGWGTKQNDALAFKYFTDAAIELQPQAIYMLGRCHEEGRATPINLSQAYEYYVAAMHQGDQDATIRIARFYEKGIVVKKDFAKAIELYVELAKRDNAFAMYKIGIAYFNGDGIKKSLESAYSWLNKALQKGSIEAMNHFRLMGTRSKTDIREASSLLAVGKDLFLSGKHEEAKTYLEIAAKEGLSEAYHLLADLHNEGKASETSSTKAFEVLQRAASLGDSEAMFKVAKKYELGEGVPSSFTKAANWYEQAYAKGYLPAKEELLGLRGYIDE